MPKGSTEYSTDNQAGWNFLFDSRFIFLLPYEEVDLNKKTYWSVFFKKIKDAPYIPQRLEVSLMKNTFYEGIYRSIQ